MFEPQWGENYPSWLIVLTPSVFEQYNNFLWANAMNLLRSEIIGRPVGALEEKAKVGVARDVIVNPEDGRVLALVVGTGIFRQGQKVVGWQDVRAVEESGVVIGSVEQMLAPREIVRVDQLMKDGFHLVGLPVVSTGGQKIGRVNNFCFDAVTGRLTQLYVRGYWGPNRIINWATVMRIEPNRVVIRHNETKGKGQARPVLYPLSNS
ncbi:MAG TPA: PRC-barrel domain-containing protein [Patescibacteria group bacterium]|nr:PRC-barrel domain-containing protein [Patescibacteria group bacterium]